MYNVYGFIEISDFISNELNNEVSVIGELSPYCRSYSREVGYFSNKNIQGVRLLTFHVDKEDVITPLRTDIADDILIIANWIITQSKENRVGSNRTAFVQFIRRELTTEVTIKDVGRLITDDRYWIPEYVEFQFKDEEQNKVKLWFVDESFKQQYDKYEIEIIPPLTIIDDFHKNASVVKSNLTDHLGKKIPLLHQKVNGRKNEIPFTHIASYNYAYVNPQDSKDTTPTTWTIIVYGQAGIDDDLIRQEIVKLVLSQTDYDIKSWETVLPDLFIPTEFYICPFWTKYATENLQLKGGIYSPVVPYRDVLPWALRTMYGYEEEHIVNNVAVLGTIFKSCAVLICGHESNRMSSPRFEELFVDYANIYTTSIDFNRLSPDTQEFIMVLNALLKEAETMTPNSNIPEGMVRTSRGQIWYISKLHEGINYLVPLRYNFLNEISNEQPTAIILPVVKNEGDSSTGDDRVKNVINMTPSFGGNTNALERGDDVIVVTDNVSGKTTGGSNVSGSDGTPVTNNKPTPAANKTTAGQSNSN